MKKILITDKTIENRCFAALLELDGSLDWHSVTIHSQFKGYQKYKTEGKVSKLKVDINPLNPIDSEIKWQIRDTRRCQLRHECSIRMNITATSLRNGDIVASESLRINKFRDLGIQLGIEGIEAMFRNALLGSLGLGAQNACSGPQGTEAIKKHRRDLTRKFESLHKELHLAIYQSVIKFLEQALGEKYVTAIPIGDEVSLFPELEASVTQVTHLLGLPEADISYIVNNNQTGDQVLRSIYEIKINKTIESVSFSQVIREMDKCLSELQYLQREINALNIKFSMDKCIELNGKNVCYTILSPLFTYEGNALDSELDRQIGLPGEVYRYEYFDPNLISAYRFRHRVAANIDSRIVQSCNVLLHKLSVIAQNANNTLQILNELMDIADIFDVDDLLVRKIDSLRQEFYFIKDTIDTTMFEMSAFEAVPLKRFKRVPFTAEDLKNIVLLTQEIPMPNWVDPIPIDQRLRIQKLFHNANLLNKKAQDIEMVVNSKMDSLNYKTM